MTGFTPAKGLDDVIAAKVLQPRVNAVAHRLLETAQRTAPPSKVWVTLEDERVRHSHRAVDGQEIPDNIPFILPRPDHMGHETGMMPRSPEFTVANRINCRCVAVTLPEAIARSMRLDPATVVAARVTAQVWTGYERAAESEHAAHGGGWFNRAAHEVAGSAGDVRA